MEFKPYITKKNKRRNLSTKRDIIYIGKTENVINKLPTEVEEMVKTNLQALQYSKASSFCDLPDWTNQGKMTDKPLRGNKLEGTHQLTIKHRDSHRVIYVATYDDLIFVIHCFKKKTEGRSTRDIKTVEQRYKTLKQDRESGKI